MGDDDLQIRLEILPTPQRLLWDELAQVPEWFVLYGGTAIALRLGHRQSVDFDLFAFRPIEPARLRSGVAFLQHAETIHQDVNTLSVIVDRDGPVKVSFFGVPKLQRVREAQRVRSNDLAIASLLDLGARNVEVIQARAERKDYLDIDALLVLSGLTLTDMLGAATTVFGTQFNPQISLKALSHFADVAGGVPVDAQERLARAARQVDLDMLPDIPPIPEIET